MSDKPRGIDKRGAYQDCGTSGDLENEEVVLRILEHGLPEQVEQFRTFHNLTKEKIEVMQYYVRLRRTTLDQMQKDIARRVQDNPRATDEELSAGAYEEQIEPQVRDAVFLLRRKGYSTTSSGFRGLHSQGILFSDPQKVELPADLISDLQNQGILVRSGKEQGIKLECDKLLTLAELKEVWNRIVETLPDRGAPAHPSITGAAELFRKRQKTLRSKP